MDDDSGQAPPLDPGMMSPRECRLYLALLQAAGRGRVRLANCGYVFRDIPNRQPQRVDGLVGPARKAGWLVNTGGLYKPTPAGDAAIALLARVLDGRRIGPA